MGNPSPLRYPGGKYKISKLIELLVNKSDETKYQRKHKVAVVSLVVLQIVGQEALVAEACVVPCIETCNPVTVDCVAMSLNIILTTREVP